MPGIKRRRPSFKRKGRSYGYKRRYTRKTRSRRGGFRRGIPRRFGPSRSLGALVPNVVRVKFHAADVWQPATNAAGSYVCFYQNNPYDPVVGASTTKCSGFDQIMGLFKLGICYGSKISVRFLNGMGVNSFTYVRAVGYTDYPITAQIDRNMALETPQNTITKFTPVYLYNQKPTYIKMYRSTKALAHKKFLDPDSWHYYLSGGPTMQQEWQVGYFPADTTNSIVYSMPMYVRITYYCKCFNRADAVAM